MRLSIFIRGYTLFHLYFLSVIGVAYYSFAVIILRWIVGGTHHSTACLVAIAAMGHALVFYQSRLLPSASAKRPATSTGLLHLLYVGGLAGGVLFMGLYALGVVASQVLPSPEAISPAFALLVLVILLGIAFYTCWASVKVFDHHFRQT